MSGAEERDRDVAQLIPRQRAPLERAPTSWKAVAVRFLTLLLFSVVASSACSSQDDAPPRNGVDNVQKACEIRATWKYTETCTNCQAAAPSPSCACEAFKDFAALCKSQDDAHRAEPTCTAEIETCTNACARSDCRCIDGCYGQAEKCRSAAASRDGCIADVCTPYCR